MKNNKIIICLAIALILTALFAVNVFAADPMLTGENKSADGDIVEVNLILSGTPEINAIAIRNVDYDKTKLELISGEWSENAQSNTKVQLFEYEKSPNTMTIYFTDRTDFNGIVATLKFRVLDKTEGSCKYSFEARAIYTDEQSKDVIKVVPTIVPGAITIACQHDDMTFVPAKPATCAEQGNIEHYTCTKCHKNFSDEAGTNEIEKVVTEKDPTNHTGETRVDGKLDPNCSNEGYTGDTVCTGCGTVINKGNVIPPDNTKHDYQWVVDKEPTFEETGLKHEECTRCHDKRSLDTVIEKNDCFHSTMEHHNKVAATCVATGTCEYWHCTECDRNYSDEKGTLKIEKVEDLVLPIDPNNHVNTEIRDVKSATCSSEGYTGDKYCTDCNTLIASGSILAINPDGHNFINNKCEYCGKIQVTYYPPTFTYIDDETHLAGGNIRSHVPDSLTMHTDGVYEWNYCLYCQHEYGRVPVAEADINIDDSVDLIVDDPVQSTNDGDDIDVDDNTDDNTDADVAEPEDNNPPTGIAIALLPMALAMAAATIVRKK